jgi:predicted metalloprotease with PDZ domain
LKVIKPSAGKAWIGNYSLRPDMSLTGPTLVGTPLYDAGLDIDDKILQLNGKAVQSQSELRTIIEDHKPGDKVTIQFQHRDAVTNAEITLSENPVYQVRTFEKEGLELTPEIIEFRKAWLGSRTER